MIKEGWSWCVACWGTTWIFESKKHSPRDMRSLLPFVQMGPAWAALQCAILQFQANQLWLEGDTNSVIPWINTDSSVKQSANPLFQYINYAVEKSLLCFPGYPCLSRGKSTLLPGYPCLSRGKSTCWPGSSWGIKWVLWNCRSGNSTPPPFAYSWSVS